MTNESFKGRSLESRIVLWGHMDEVVSSLKDKRATAYWRREGIPHPKGGGDFKIRKTSEGNKKVCKLNYENIVCNRFWWKSEFAECDWSRIEKAFLMSLQVGLQECPKTLSESKNQ